MYVDPCPKPRQTHKDRFNPSDRVLRYRTFADLLRFHLHNARVNLAQTFIDNGGELSLTFHIPMPQSWSAKKRAQHVGTPCKTKPDLDNLIKAFKDAILVDDAFVWRYGRMEKRWSDEGAIVVHGI